MGTCFTEILLITCFQLCIPQGWTSAIVYSSPRRETDLNSLKFGVSLDYSYNETEAYVGESISSPGCPASYEGRPWVYYGRPIKCYLVGFIGPCPHGQRIFAVKYSKYGVCNCDCFAKEVNANRPVTLNLPRPVTNLIDYTINDISNTLVLHPRNRQSSRSKRSPGLSYQRFPFFVWNNQRRPCNRTGSQRNPVTIEFQSPSTSPKPEDDNIEVEIGTRMFSNKDRYSSCFSEWHGREVSYDSVRQKCTPFLDQGPCKKGEWLVKNLEKFNGVTCEKRKCPEVNGVNVQPEFGGSFSYFDYKYQICRTEVYGNLLESVFTAVGSILTGGNSNFCRNAGMRYSVTLRTCIKDISKEFQYNAGIG